MGLGQYKRVTFFKGDVLNVLPEYVRSVTVLSMLSQAFDCMSVPCVIGAVCVVKDSYLLFRDEKVITNNK